MEQKQNPMKACGELFAKLGIPMYDNFPTKIPTIEEFDRMLVDQRNQSEGDLPDYDCRKCRNKGWILRLDENGFEVAHECECMKIRETIWAIKKIGLGRNLEKCKFSSFNVDGKQWRQDMLNTCLDYVKNGGDYWLYVGGQSQTGKTHLCTAVCSHLINAGKSIKYIMWKDLIHQLEGVRFKVEEYNELIQDVKNAEILYLDDFMKSPTHESNGEDIPEMPKTSDLDFAYEIINGRIITGKKTIISSEYYLSEVARYEAAVCGRIHSMTDNGRYVVTIKRDSDKKYSLQR